MENAKAYAEAANNRRKVMLQTSDVFWCYCTAQNTEEAKKIGRAAVEGKLAACANILGSGTSIYLWEGQVKESDEAYYVMKTTGAKVNLLKALVEKESSYETPCFLALKVEMGLENYLKWLRTSV